MQPPALPPETTDTPPLPSPPSRAWLRWALLGVFVVGIAGFYVLGLHHYFSWDYVRANLDSLKARVDGNLVVAVLVFFAIYVAVTALSIPVAVLLSLLAGALFGRWVGTGMVSVAATLGATLAFLSSRYILRDWVQRRFGERLVGINRGIEKDGAYYLFTLRLVPAIPFWLINLAMGLTPMRVLTFAVVSWVGMLPGTFLYINAGTELGKLESPAGLVSWQVLGSLALLGIVPLVLRKLIPRRTKE